MKRLLAISLFLLTAARLDAQWLNSDVYDRPLKEVLQQVEEQYGIKLLYEDKNVKGRIVKSAPWRFYDDAEATLDNILRPLDMRWAAKTPGVYEIKKWEYFRKPYAEGEKHLKRLLELYPSREAFEARKARIRTHILATLGLDSLKKCDLAPIRSNLRRARRLHRREHRAGGPARRLGLGIALHARAVPGTHSRHALAARTLL